MLHLKFALNLENLADQMIDEISRYWKNPFEAPVVIFPDPKLEQWFRLRWVQKKGVLANLNKTTIDRFLFDILAGKDKSRKKLNSDMLANVIISYLQQKTDGKSNYELLGESVKAYLEDDGVVDENRSFDFANVIAGLFREYETSRPC
jgi:exodeoxyribonuclease V gamma subunit